MQMALFNKIRRYGKGRYVIYGICACLVLYLFLTFSLVAKGRLLQTEQVIEANIPSNSNVEDGYALKQTNEEVDPYNRERKETFNNDNAPTAFLKNDRFAQKSFPSLPVQTLPCNPESIPAKYILPHEDISCVAHKSSQQACEFANKLYWRDKNLKTCGERNSVRKIDICSFVKINNNSDFSTFKFKCSFEDCKRFNRHRVTVLRFDSTNSDVIKHNTYEKAENLEKDLPNIAKVCDASGYNFLFLECGKYQRQITYNTLSQLLILPPSFSKSKHTHRTKRSKVKLKLNVNLVLLDSAARAHFYRSLPNTLNTFTHVNKNTTSEVLDFQLFQAMEGHTAENLHALFSGTLFPKEFTGADRENSPVQIGKLLQYYKLNGYHTIYQDDLCYKEWWGLRLDLGGPSTWKEFIEKQKENFIDQTGLTFASCRILEYNNVTNPFNGPRKPLCFNSKFHHKYLLDYIQIYHNYASKQNTPLLTFTTLNVAHDHTGRRIQSLDDDLSEFVTNILKLPNTITILFSDHGNTYTHYTHAIMEGRFEQYHPSLFFLIPKNVQETLGSTIMSNLRKNTKKIVTLLDLHYALVNIPTKPTAEGIFGMISNNRSCDDLDLRLPNLCVCEGWDVETRNGTTQIGLLDFAVGELNNRILQFQENIRSNGTVPNCMRLVPRTYYDVRERNNKDKLVTSMTFTTKSGKGSSYSEDVFYVQIESSILPQKASREMKLLSFDRISQYGPYRICSDKGIDMKLCVCNLEQTHKHENIQDLIKYDIMASPTTMPTDIQIKLTTKVNPCLYYKIRSYPDVDEKEDTSIFSASYEIANICDIQITVTLILDLDNMKLTGQNPVTKVVPPYSVIYMGSAIRSVPYWNSKVESIDIIAKNGLLDSPFSEDTLEDI